MTDKNRFFSSDTHSTSKPFGLLFKEQMSPPSLNNNDGSSTAGMSPPTNTPRGSDNGGVDVDFDF